MHMRWSTRSLLRLESLSSCSTATKILSYGRRIDHGNALVQTELQQTRATRSPDKWHGHMIWAIWVHVPNLDPPFKPDEQVREQPVCCLLAAASS